MVCWEGDLGGCCCFGLGEGYFWVACVLGGHFGVWFCFFVSWIWIWFGFDVGMLIDQVK